MGDMESALKECYRAQNEGREISDACARVIASMYHEGQASRSYSFASTGYIGDSAYGTSPLWREMFPNYTSMPKEEAFLADMMGTYLLARLRRDEMGKVEGWSDLWL